MRLIDADKLIERINGTGYAEQTKSNLRFMVDMQSTIDAVEVVRCENCKWWKECNNVKDYIDGFCSYGERKEEE